MTHHVTQPTKPIFNPVSLSIFFSFKRIPNEGYSYPKDAGIFCTEIGSLRSQINELYATVIQVIWLGSYKTKVNTVPSQEYDS